MVKCERCWRLEQALAEVIRERDEAREAASKATDLMMKGEALREQMTLRLITAQERDREVPGRGIFNPKV